MRDVFFDISFASPELIKVRIVHIKAKLYVEFIVIVLLNYIALLLFLQMFKLFWPGGGIYKAHVGFAGFGVDAFSIKAQILTGKNPLHADIVPYNVPFCFVDTPLV